jgi:phage gp29-like protein
MSAPAHNNRMLRNANTWRQQYDALRWLDVPRAVRLLEQERRGIHAETQYTYDLVDSVDPDMLALIQLRLAAIKRLKWRVACAAEDTAGFDKVLADEQEEALRALYDRMRNLVAATADLALATFRGYSVLQIRRDSAGDPVSICPLDRWLFARDGMRGDWWWNPTAQTLAGRSLPEADRLGGPELPLADFVLREVPFAVDRVALLASVRSSTVEKDWDAWCEMYGLHPSIVTEPPNAKPEDRPSYDAAARAFSDGQGGTLPNGAAVVFPNSVTVDAPFEKRAEYLTRKKVLAGTSGMLTMLAESGSGTLAGGAHQDTFDSLAEAEAAEISELLQRSIDAPFLTARFAGRPVLAWFELQPHRKKDPDKVADRVAKVAAHYDFDADELTEELGLTVTPKAVVPGGAGVPPAPSPLGLAFANGATLRAAVNSRATAPAPADVPDPDDLEGAAVEALAEARAEGLAPVVERLLDALSKTDPESLRKSLASLLADLPRLAEAAGAGAEADAELVERILSDAVGAGHADAAKKGATP